MLFLVPDSPGNPDNPDDEKAEDQRSASDDKSAKDSADSADDSVKVELDLDDAPFLMEEEEAEKEEEAKEPEKVDEVKPEDEGKKLGFFATKKRRIIFGSAALVLILLIGGGAFWIFGGVEDRKADQSAEEKSDGPRVVVVPSEEPVHNATLPFSSTVELSTFIVPQEGSEGETLFLRCKLALPISDPVQQQEIRARNLEIRDAFYYYLINRAPIDLRSEEEYQTFKEDLVRVINEHISIKKLEDVYIQEYVVTGQ